MEEGTRLYQQLQKISAIKSEEDLQQILTTLWKTRKTGLSAPQKSSVQSLLNLPSISEVDPVLACLRSLIRKCVHHNFSSDDIMKLFPPDLPLDLQSILITLLQRNQNQWKDEISTDQHLLPRTTFSHPVNASLLPPLISSPPSEMIASLWPQQDDSVAQLDHHNVGASKPLIVESNVPRAVPIPLHSDAGPDNLEILPRLKSMTWTLENYNSPIKRVAVISLKLQDYTNSPFGEKEVKFQLTRDALEAMLKSMSYINGQLKSYAESSGQLQKKQRH